MIKTTGGFKWLHRRLLTNKRREVNSNRRNNNEILFRIRFSYNYFTYFYNY